MPIKVYNTTVTQIFELTMLKNQTFLHPGFGFPNSSVLRAYPNNRGVMRPSEKFEAKAAGQKGSEAWFSPR